jgi:hypothetical protein
MTNSRQCTLFALPAVQEFSLTLAQRTVLDAILLSDGCLGCGRYSVSRRALRNAIEAGLVEVVELSPATYRVTPIGRAVRSNGMARRSDAIAEAVE